MSRFDYVRYDADSMAHQDAFKLCVEDLEERLHNVKIPITLPDGMAVCQQTEHVKRAQEYQKLALNKLEEFYMYIGKLVRERQILKGVHSPDSPERGQ